MVVDHRCVDRHDPFGHSGVYDERQRQSDRDPAGPRGVVTTSPRRDAVVGLHRQRQHAQQKESREHPQGMTHPLTPSRGPSTRRRANRGDPSTAGKGGWQPGACGGPGSVVEPGCPQPEGARMALSTDSGGLPWPLTCPDVPVFQSPRPPRSIRGGWNRRGSEPWSLSRHRVRW